MASQAVDPRVLRTRHDVLCAASEVLLEEGWEQVTLSRVAERAGYARATLYRHWPNRLDLLRDTFEEQAQLLHSTPTGTLRADLIAELEAFRLALTTTGLGHMLAAVAQQAHTDPEFAALNRTMEAEGTRVLRSILHDAITRGELTRDTAIDDVVALLAGPLLYRCLFIAVALDTTFIDTAVDAILNACTAFPQR